MFLYYLYVILSPFLSFVLYLISFFNSKVKDNLYHYRQSCQDAAEKLKNNHKSVLLFHAASSGEFEQIQPILKRIDRNKYFIIQTCTSPTLYNNKNQYKQYIDVMCYQPFDSIIGSSKYFFKTLNPDLYIITRHDLWPKHIYTAYALNIKIFFINANVHKRSIWMHSLVLPLSKFLFSKIYFIAAPSSDIKNNLDKISMQLQTELIPDTRYDQIKDRYEKSMDAPPLLAKKYLKTSNIIFGSIDTEDFHFIAKALSHAYPQGSQTLKKDNIQLLLVPHEPNATMIKLITEKLKSLNFDYTLLTNDQSLDFNDATVLIVDKVGILAELYKYAKLAYVGGGFTRGVHSVIEPAIYDCIISYGPNIEMLAEAKELVNQKISHLISNINDLVNFIKLINNTKHITQSSRKYIMSQSSSSNQIIQSIYEVF